MSAAAHRGLAALLVCVNGAMVLLALVLGLHFEATPRALADAAKGQAVGIPAGLGLLAALVALAGARRTWGVGALAVAAVCALLAVVLYAVR